MVPSTPAWRRSPERLPNRSAAVAFKVGYPPPILHPTYALRIVYLNLMSRDELMSLNGIGPTLADDILRERPFRTRQEMQTKVHIADGRWNQMQRTPGVEVRIFQRG